jgi:hypothetical protein
MIDRLVCADGGNPDPTSTARQGPEEAKALELAGLGLSQAPGRPRAYGVVVHGDVAGIERRGARCPTGWTGWA